MAKGRRISSSPMFIQLFDAIENSDTELLTKLLRSNDFHVLSLSNVQFNGCPVLNHAVKKAADIFKAYKGKRNSSRGGDLDDDKDERSLTIVKLLLENGAGANSAEKDQAKIYPALLLAVRSGYLELCKLLCKHGADVNATASVNGKETALLIAAKSGNSELIDLLIEYNVNVSLSHKPFQDENGAETDSFENSPLYATLKFGHIQYTRQLLNNGAQLNLSKALQVTIRQCQADALCLLIEHMPTEAKLQIRSDWGAQSLRWACQKRDSAIAEILLKEGADPNCQDSNGKTPLMLSSDPEITCALIKHGADLSAMLVNNKGERRHVVDVVIENGWLSVAELLIQCGAKVYDETLISAMSKKKMKSLILLMLQAGANVNCVDSEGTPLLHLALSNWELIPTLVEYGANISKVNSKGDSLLMEVVRKLDTGASAVLRTLLKLGADVNFVNPFTNQSAMSILMDQATCDIKEWHLCVKELIEHNAKATENCNKALAHSIQKYKTEVASLIMQTGTGPHYIPQDYIYHSARHVPVLELLENEVTPFILALFTGKTIIARNIVENLYLMTSDLQRVYTNNPLRLQLQDHGYTECLALVNNFFAQPLTLFESSFIAVSSSLGSAPGREDKVRQLGLPPLVQRRLLFRKNHLC